MPGLPARRTRRSCGSSARRRACGGAPGCTRLGPAAAVRRASGRARSSGSSRTARAPPGSAYAPGRRHPRAVVVAFAWRGADAATPSASRSAPPWPRGWTAATPSHRHPGRGRPRSPRPRAPGRSLVTPRIPVASVTGTNGKTTTTRLLAHIGMTAGLKTAWSSTDGVLVQGEVLEEGDYSGPGRGPCGALGARGAAGHPGDRARGHAAQGHGRGSANDVSVVTNVSADHLGLQGIDTVDQLAEVKAIVTRATKPVGWVVLNGDDPRVWAMRAGARAGRGCSACDPDSPALRESLNAGGRAVTVLDGDLVVLWPGRGPRPPGAGRRRPGDAVGALGQHNIANALAAAAAALGLGLPREAVVEGLRTFAPDPLHNPGRMNVYSVRSAGRRHRHGHRRPGPQRGRPGGAAARRRGAAPARGGRAPRPRHRRRPHRRDPAGARRARRARADRVTAVHKEHYLRGRVDARPRGPAADRVWPGSGSARWSPTRPSSRGCRRWWPRPRTATSSR